MQIMNKNGFSRCGELYIGRLQREGRFSTAHVYKNALFSFSNFCGTQNVSFRQVTRECLRRYGQHLSDCGLKPNTVSTYMRMLRSIYNRGVEAGSAPYVPRLFHDVYTGVDVRQKKALPATELHKLLYEDPKTDRLRRTQAIAGLMFQFCGMSFADLSHLEKSALDSNVLRYNRVKTKTPMSVEVLDSAQEMLEQLRNRRSPRPGCPDYLFGILQGDKKRKDEKAYREYQSALRRFNNHLKGLAKALRLTSPVTSYTLRHSWATTAKYRGVPIEMISESLGHKSIKTTQIYLKGFGLKERTEVNKMKKALLKCIAASVAALTLLGAVTVIILKSPKKKSSFTESEETTVAALYTITDYNGKIALFKRGYSMPVEIFDVNTNSLPQSDRELIIVGVTAYSDEEAQKLVEDYTS